MMTDIVTGYLAAFLVAAFIGVVMREYGGNHRTRKWGARVLLLAPLWPLELLAWACLAVAQLWREAEWGRGRED